MTERGGDALRRSAETLGIGRSCAGWVNGRLVCDFEEMAVPFPMRVSGHVEIDPGPAGAPAPFALDDAGRHLWWPAAPRARIEVMFRRPALHWQGEAYFDGNFGARALEHDFIGWQWSRSSNRDETAIFYDVRRRDGTDYNLAWTFAADGGIAARSAPPSLPLPSGLWGVPGAVRSDADAAAPRLIRRLVDAPFYTRSQVQTTLSGARSMTVHESLSLERFKKAWVRLMLPFRMPRAIQVSPVDRSLKRV